MARSLIGACGKLCVNCAIFIATTTGDESKKARLASEYNKEHDKKIKQSSISCWGCNSPDRSCLRTDCHFRNCAHDRGIEFCYRCPKFACDKLKDYYESNPASRENLHKVCKIGLEAFFADINKQNE
jgi:hypothetical protein